MEGKRLSTNGPASSPEIVGATRFPQPNYNSVAVREALEHLATIDLIELCNEAKIERCRAPRDLRSCGRSVHDVLISCGHSSLCAECSQRYDICPICRVSIPNTGNRTRLRLYDECKQAGLISRMLDERLVESEDGSQGDADVQRLYALFDVALENNLVSLICHYVTDVCMDESAVSSDPVTAFLLDEVVVKDWCKRVFRNILTELQQIYNLDMEQMKSRFSLLLKFSVQLRAVSNVLEILDTSFKDSLSPQLHDLHYLNECILKMKQHLEVMMWCIRHDFLENVRSQHSNYSSWCSIVRERKSAAIKRSWPDVVNSPAESSIQDGSLFIEDALRNLEVEGESINETEDLSALQKNGGSLFLRSKIEGLFGCYPFENLRVAVDTLFLYGSSDLVVAKLAIFLYYLYDRYWTLPDEEWRETVDDFGATFRISRHSLLESLTFYLLDDHTEEALQEACHLLPEISNPTTHPKIAQVLVERQMPEIALWVLRWSGHDGGAHFQSLPEAVTAIRVRVECGLLTEAFTHQRMLCTKVREKKQRLGAWPDPSDDCQDQGRTWVEWMEILVTEMCCLCIRRKFVDRIIELPWNSDEEKFLHKCLLDYAIEDPSNITGSLLVVFYLQRQRYSEAHKVDRELQRLEEDFQSSNPLDEELVSRVQAVSKWRSMLIDKSLDLLPEVLQQQIKSGTYPDSLTSSNKPVEMSELPSQEQGPSSTSLLFSSQTGSSLLLRKEGGHSSTLFPEPLPFETPISSIFPNRGPHSASRDRSLMNTGRGLIPQFGVFPKSSKVNEVSTPRRYAQAASPRSSFKFPENSHVRETSPNQISPDTEQNGYLSSINYNSPYSAPKTALSNKSDQQYYSFPTSESHQKKLSGKRLYSSTDERPWNAESSEDPMDVTWSGTKAYSVESDSKMAAAPRWRSDEEEDEGSVQLPYAAATPSRGTRRSRFAIR